MALGALACVYQPLKLPCIGPGCMSSVGADDGQSAGGDQRPADGVLWADGAGDAHRGDPIVLAGDARTGDPGLHADSGPEGDPGSAGDVGPVKGDGLRMGDPVPREPWYGLAGSAPGPFAAQISSGASVETCYQGTAYDTPATGSISNTVGCSEASDLAIDAAGNPTVAWHDDSSGNWEIYVRRFDGVAWQELAGSASGAGISLIDASLDGTSGFPSVALDSFIPGTPPIVAWHDDTETTNIWQVYLREYVATPPPTWQGLAGSDVAASGGLNNDNRISARPKVAVDGQTGNVFVAWEDRAVATNYDVLLRRYHRADNDWQDVDGSTTLGTISDLAGMNQLVSLGLDNTGRTLVAWQFTAPGGRHQNPAQG